MCGGGSVGGGLPPRSPPSLGSPPPFFSVSPPPFPLISPLFCLYSILISSLSLFSLSASAFPTLCLSLPSLSSVLLPPPPPPTPLLPLPLPPSLALNANCFALLGEECRQNVKSPAFCVVHLKRSLIYITLIPSPLPPPRQSFQISLEICVKRAEGKTFAQKVKELAKVGSTVHCLVFAFCKVYDVSW